MKKLTLTMIFILLLVSSQLYSARVNEIRRSTVSTNEKYISPQRVSDKFYRNYIGQGVLLERFNATKNVYETVLVDRNNQNLIVDRLSESSMPYMQNIKLVSAYGNHIVLLTPESENLKNVKGYLAHFYFKNRKQNRWTKRKWKIDYGTSLGFYTAINNIVILMEKFNNTPKSLIFFNGENNEAKKTVFLKPFPFRLHYYHKSGNTTAYHKGTNSPAKDINFSKSRVIFILETILDKQQSEIEIFGDYYFRTIAEDRISAGWNIHPVIFRHNGKYLTAIISNSNNKMCYWNLSDPINRGVKSFSTRSSKPNDFKIINRWLFIFFNDKYLQGFLLDNSFFEESSNVERTIETKMPTHIKLDRAVISGDKLYVPVSYRKKIKINLSDGTFAESFPEIGLYIKSKYFGTKDLFKERIVRDSFFVWASFGYAYMYQGAHRIDMSLLSGYADAPDVKFGIDLFNGRLTLNNDKPFSYNRFDWDVYNFYVGDVVFIGMTLVGGRDLWYDVELNRDQKAYLKTNADVLEGRQSNLKLLFLSPSIRIIQDPIYVNSSFAWDFYPSEFLWEVYANIKVTDFAQLYYSFSYIKGGEPSVRVSDGEYSNDRIGTRKNVDEGYLGGTQLNLQEHEAGISFHVMENLHINVFYLLSKFDLSLYPIAKDSSGNVTGVSKEERHIVKNTYELSNVGVGFTMFY